jgi:transcriptional pleiotropic regulator of transition state genes
MAELNAIRKIDELGRIVLPGDFRKRSGWGIGDGILLTLSADCSAITLTLDEKNPEPKCVFCGATESKTKINGIDVCADCVERFKDL